MSDSWEPGPPSPSPALAFLRRFRLVSVRCRVSSCWAAMVAKAAATLVNTPCSIWCPVVRAALLAELHSSAQAAGTLVHSQQHADVSQLMLQRHATLLHAGPAAQCLAGATARRRWQL